MYAFFFKFLQKKLNGKALLTFVDKETDGFNNCNKCAYVILDRFLLNRKGTCITGSEDITVCTSAILIKSFVKMYLRQTEIGILI